MAPTRARSAAAGGPRTASTVNSTPAKTEAAASGTESGPSARRGGTLNLPFVTAEFRKPDLHLPGGRDVGAAAGAVTAKVRSLSPTELAYYAGLGLLAVVDLVEWPVALIVGAGTALARSGVGAERGQPDTTPRPAGANAQASASP